MSGIIFNYTLMFVAILLVASLAGYLSEHVGIVNIGIDGMMCFGAVFFAIFSAPMFKMSNVGPGMFIFPLIMTMALTSITGVMHAFASIKLKANHIISGTVINLIGVAFAAFVNAPLGNVFYGQTRLASGFNDFLYLGNSIYGSSIIMCLLAVIIAVVIFIFMHYTRVGLRYRAVGENPNAVDAQGINVTKYQ
ncbi:hypothetical protein FACS1894166_07660 [Bacilli bacterium]|nr:hypothetical protein FACS1894166_07660 [Bacilli bacterium]